MGSDAHLGYRAEETLSESFARRASGVACDLVRVVNGKKGYARHPETLRWKGKLRALYSRHEALVSEMAVRGYRHRSPLTKRHASGGARQEVFVDTPRRQLEILRRKCCQCDV